MHGTRRADRGAEGGELRPAEGKRPPGQPDADHPVPPSPAHSVIIRPTAACRARSMVCTSGPNDPGPPARTPGPPPDAGRSRRRGAAIPAGGPGAVDGRAEHLADGFEAHAADGGELPRSARTPTCRWTAAPPSGPRPRRAVLRSRPQPRPPPRMDAGPGPARAGVAGPYRGGREGRGERSPSRLWASGHKSGSVFARMHNGLICAALSTPVTCSRSASEALPASG